MAVQPLGATGGKAVVQAEASTSQPAGRLRAAAVATVAGWEGAAAGRKVCLGVRIGAGDPAQQDHRYYFDWSTEGYPFPIFGCPHKMCNTCWAWAQASEGRAGCDIKCRECSSF